MATKDIAFLSATELGTAIQAKEISPVEAVEAYLERIDRIDPQVNSYITVTAEQARQEALVAEKEIRGGNYRGPLHGIPMGIKDQIYTKGVRTTDGSKIRSDFIPKFDATVVTNLKKAGAIVLGKVDAESLGKLLFDLRSIPGHLDIELMHQRQGVSPQALAHLPEILV